MGLGTDAGRLVRQLVAGGLSSRSLAAYCLLAFAVCTKRLPGGLLFEIDATRFVDVSSAYRSCSPWRRSGSTERYNQLGARGGSRDKPRPSSR